MKKCLVAVFLLVAWMGVNTTSAWAQEIEWTRQFGSSSFDQALGISVDASGVYVAGVTGGTLPGQISLGDWDAFVRKYDLNVN